jgi:hypothetical protein
MPRTTASLVLAGLLATGALASAQDMEPRAYSASPVGANFLVVVATRSTGAVLLDPAIPVTDINATVNGFALGLGHTFNLFGKLGLVSVALPYAVADVTGKVMENAAEVHRSGLADSRLKLSVNLYGNDAMSPREFAAAPTRTVVGASLAVTAPTSQYSSTKLINLGTNRWSVKPEVGVAVPSGHWDFDAYLGLVFYTDNTDFYPGVVDRSQDPLWSVQGHVSYTIRPRLWIAGDATWYHGGSAQNEGGNPSPALNNARGGVTVSVPVLKRYSLKVAYGSGVVARTGTDFRTFSVAWQALWLSPRWSGR